MLLWIHYEVFTFLCVRFESDNTVQDMKFIFRAALLKNIAPVLTLFRTSVQVTELYMFTLSKSIDNDTISPWLPGLESYVFLIHCYQLGH